ncbi:MAG: hypothetical protein A4C66_01895 [Nitrospira sp. HN-bin3]|uniref:hypothetical protein n=1 Tax=Nitrospira cf. moscoviensis SBR1015 TaxID=96242 RepID=UPI000A0BCD2D|nr:hypothetical protein [Nitrospira cf. moscoviensis SBR1015]OQW43716.1 MAG: hypothetical protein A4C66_01895 [Nitrospira sp. HN-bin3]
MFSDPIACALFTPGHLRFHSSRALAESFHKGGGYVETLPTGHLVFYRPDGRRFLAADPAGHPLHECEWESNANGVVSLARARVQLDWGGWVGVTPAGLVNETTVNLATRLNWQRTTPEDLRGMAARALRVPIEEVRWFYRDEDVAIDPTGLATIRQRKDALSVLDDGGFDNARFMSCMGAMHWEEIDFLPVVELFKSLLPGTGSAVLELIRGLYDDQQRGRSEPRPLRYRGIPPYPSESAFRLFSAFFTPCSSGTADPFVDFMNPEKSHVVTWMPADHVPVRYFDKRQGVCVTVRDGVVQKATLATDTVGLAYVNPLGRRVLPLDRSLRIDGHQMILKDREQETIVPLPAGLHVRTSLSPEKPLSPADWRAVFMPEPPRVRPSEAFGAVLLYPEGHEEISELAAQPFVADYLDDLGEQDREIGRIRSLAERVLIVNGDAVISTCVLFDRPRDYRVSVRHRAYAQRQAQQLWTQCAEINRWDWLQRIRMMVEEVPEEPGAGHGPHDLLYLWFSYDAFGSPMTMRTTLAKAGRALRRGGDAFVVGPVELQAALASEPWQVCWSESVAALPTFAMHKTILPKARVKTGLTLFHLRRL